jgi:Spy/CpxP family protein refolding chaperone
MGMRGPMGGGGRGGSMGQRGFGGEGFLSPAIRQRLGITPDQVTKIHQQELDFQKAQIRNRADLEVKRIELNELIAADSPDHAAIDAKLQEVSAAQMASEKSEIDNRLALRDVLTPAQRQQLQQLRTNGFQQAPNTQSATGPAGRGNRRSGQPGSGAPPPPNAQGQAPPANQ